MKSVKLDEKKLKKEKTLREEKIKDDIERDEYLEKLKEDARFQKYVVEGILKKTISELTDTRLIEKSGINLDKKQEIGELVIQSIMASKQLSKILSQLL